jgi:hypothetical protein
LENGTQAKTNSAKLSQINFEQGSSGSVIMGFELSYGIFLNTSGITIKRNKTPFIVSADNLAIENIIISQNLISANCSYGFVSINIPLGQNIIISNNLLYCVSIGISVGNVVLSNNIFVGYGSVCNAAVQNNIFVYNGSISNCGNSMSNNIFGYAFNDLFIDGSSPDGKWQLKPGSPAIGAGVGGVDCGMYGGDNPYVLSGIPSIPTIYFFNAPIEWGNQLPVQIKIKSNK